MVLAKETLYRHRYQEKETNNEDRIACNHYDSSSQTVLDNTLDGHPTLDKRESLLDDNSPDCHYIRWGHNQRRLNRARLVVVTALLVLTVVAVKMNLDLG